MAKLGKFMKAAKGDLPLDLELKLTLQRLLNRLEAGKPVNITRQLFCTGFVLLMVLASKNVQLEVF